MTQPSTRCLPPILTLRRGMRLCRKVLQSLMRLLNTKLSMLLVNWRSKPSLPIMFEQTRITSNPPTLPEIRVPERSLSPVPSLGSPVPLSARESPSPFSVEFSNVRTPPPAGLKLASSPLATSTPASAKPTVISHETKVEAKSSKRPDTVYTLYEEEDAYGGI